LLNKQFFTPYDVPQEILKYQSEVKQLGVGKEGKVGELRLGLEKDPSSGKTVLKEQYSRVPLFSQRALYYEGSVPSMAHIHIISPSGGVLQGDRYRMDISLRHGAISHITTQGATRVYGMKEDYATQIINISLDENCYLEFIPDQIIPYRNSKFYQKSNLNVHENSTMIFSEIITPGRVAMGESFEYDICYIRTTAKNQNGLTRFFDAAKLEPKRNKFKSIGMLGNFTIVGTVYVLTKREHVLELCDEINSNLEKFSSVLAGASILPKETGIFIRILGNMTDEIKDTIYEIVKIVRKKSINADFDGIVKP